MNAFDTAAVLIAIAALTGYINHRVLKLSATTGTLAVALVSSFVVLAADAVVPGWRLREVLSGFLGEIDFNEALMHGMLCFLLFAGSLHIDLEGLLKHKWTIGALATVGVLLSTLAVGTLTWWALRLLGVDVPFVVCLVFGALISPTDPIAVMGLLKELNAPRGLEAQIAGESLFNDGIAVVVFFALVSVAGLSGAGEMEAITMSATGLTSFFLQEVLGAPRSDWGSDTSATTRSRASTIIRSSCSSRSRSSCSCTRCRSGSMCRDRLPWCWPVCSSAIQVVSSP